ncbi:MULTISPECIES: hypothetical protein [Alphaproteobacteria]|uniref:IacB n=2 Tax=Alphaproteobacteria TaxID=28211 RepID=A0A512HH16_9HYPH|nr:MULTISPECIES: hypothetical protein [Alphaproteobacteria]GEO84747.1 hypothetical protein RNA01_16790 [Ciceribacter naphthalenivorans]GLR20632.1 hypothetical protein GCM10007920_04160 [Ciceribacter naphthalenivorans]GLT03488.1 hypothetical protein GCM10007926_04160 [Sphingomonas psychrolutea]
MSEPTPIRTLLCFAMQPAFFDLPFGQIGPVWKATQTLMASISKLEGVAIIGTLDDDQTQVGTSQTFPWTWYMLCDFPDRQAVIAACNLLRTIVVDEEDHRLWKYMRVEARMGRALTIPEL